MGYASYWQATETKKQGRYIKGNAILNLVLSLVTVTEDQHRTAAEYFSKLRPMRVGQIELPEVQHLYNTCRGGMSAAEPNQHRWNPSHLDAPEMVGGNPQRIKGI